MDTVRLVFVCYISLYKKLQLSVEFMLLEFLDYQCRSYYLCCCYQCTPASTVLAMLMPVCVGYKLVL